MWLPKFLRGLWLPTNNKAYVLVRLAAFAEVGEVCMNAKKLFTLLDLCVSSLRRGHANLLCIVPILLYVLPEEHVYRCMPPLFIYVTNLTCACHGQTCPRPPADAHALLPARAIFRSSSRSTPSSSTFVRSFARQYIFSFLVEGYVTRCRNFWYISHDAL